MEKLYLKELLKKYEKGELTQEEHQFLIRYYELFKTEPDVLDSLSSEKKKQFKDQMAQNIWTMASKREKRGARVITLNRKVIGMTAAAAVLLVLLTGIVFFWSDMAIKKEAIARHEMPQKSNRVFRLPDGSTVILRPDSKLNYPSSFDAFTKREVYLEGQAYFDISHNELKPFIVHTGKLETTVLGTAFSIKAYKGDKDITVTVSRGKVRVSDQGKILGILTPRQRLSFNTINTKSVQQVVPDADSSFDWKGQDLFFDNLTLADAAVILEARYNVKIIINDESIKSNRFTTTFLRDETLDQVLESICEFKGTNYHYDKEKATVTIGTH